MASIEALARNRARRLRPSSPACISLITKRAALASGAGDSRPSIRSRTRSTRSRNCRNIKTKLIEMPCSSR